MSLFDLGREIGQEVSQNADTEYLTAEEAQAVAEGAIGDVELGAAKIGKGDVASNSLPEKLKGLEFCERPTQDGTTTLELCDLPERIKSNDPGVDVDEVLREDLIKSLSSTNDLTERDQIEESLLDLEAGIFDSLRGSQEPLLSGSGDSEDKFKVSAEIAGASTTPTDDQVEEIGNQKRQLVVSKDEMTTASVVRPTVSGHRI